MGTERKTRNLVPQAISALRIFLSFIFLYLFSIDANIGSICVFLFACFTDIIDGMVARWLDVSSSSGAYLDAIADCTLVFTAFFAFVLDGIYPFWILILIGFMFLQFIISSKLKKPIYDPIGRYCGVFFFLTIGITLIFPNPSVHYALLLITIGFTIIALISRYVTIYTSKNPM